MKYLAKNKTWGLCFLPIFLFLLTAPAAYSQEGLGKGRISGTVVDEGGNPIAGATVVAESMKAIGTKLEGTSDNKGLYAISGFGSGMWRLTVSKKGYQSSGKEKDIKQLSRNDPINFTLLKASGFAALLADEESFALFDKGNVLMEEKKYDEALEVFQEFMTKYPDVYEVNINIGTCHLKQGDLDQAEAAFKLVLDGTMKTVGDYGQDATVAVPALTGLGEVFLQREEFEEAQKYFSQALEIDPNDAVGAYNVGEVLFSHQKIDEAIIYFEMAVNIKNDWSKPIMKLGYVFLNKGDFDRSLEYFNQFIEMDPENPEVPNVKNMITAIKNMN
ncbi:tetratricopeptide repeat protein [Acidobacteriota bacterium]